MDRMIDYFNRRYNHVDTIFFLTSLIIKKIYILPNTTGEVMWSCNITAIENEREKCESLLF